MSKTWDRAHGIWAVILAGARTAFLLSLPLRRPEITARTSRRLNAPEKPASTAYDSGVGARLQREHLLPVSLQQLTVWQTINYANIPTKITVGTIAYPNEWQ